MNAKNKPEPSETLLKTKNHIPRTRSVLVPRPRLIELINRHKPPCFTLISAPAGFGKTTLLSDWVHQHKIQAAWVSLDAADNDPVRFLGYVSAALMTVDPTVGDDALAAIQSPQSVPTDRILTLVVNDIAEYQGSVALILDDYQFIESEEVHQALFSVIDHLPQNLHILLASRVDPPWPFARFRARGIMNEIRASDLRFTDPEAHAFLNEMMDLSLSQAEISQLGERTEGWIAGLQMVALSLQDRSDRTQFIEAFSGSNRYILDYLMEEVLEHQAEDIRTFLLETSILDRMCAPLCQKVTGQSNAQEILEQIDRSNLFLVPLDDDRRWYRYHHLFADLLQSRLKELQSARIRELHEAASVWFEERNLINEAIHHGFEADDRDRSIQLIESNSLELVFQGGLGTLERWLRLLPPEIVERNPRLCLAQAWVSVYSGNIDACRQAIESCEESLSLSAEDAEGIDFIRGQLLSVRAYVAWFDGDIQTSEASATKALSLLPESDVMGRAWASEVLGAMLRSKGKFEEALVHLNHALDISLRADAYHIAIDTLWELSVLTYYRGQLDETMRICQKALDLANKAIREGSRRLPVVGYIYTRTALVHWSRGEFERALEQALEGVRLSERWGFTDVLVMSYNALARIQASLGDYEHALQTLHRCKTTASDLSEHYLDTAKALEALIAIENDDLSSALDWLNHAKLKATDSIEFLNISAYRTFARVQIAHAVASKKPIAKPMIDLTVRLVKICDDAGAYGPLVEMLVINVLAYQANGRKQEAIEKLDHALQLAQGERHIQPFLECRAELLEYLRVLHRKGKHTDIIDQILQRGEIIKKRGMSERAALLLAEELSERELDVLRYLPSQLSTNEIADELYVATSTVRSHIKSIYGKLAVHSRREAVARARELDLL